MQAWKLAFGAVAVATGCAQVPRARTITGPDGTDMIHVSCGSDQGACFALAGVSCPGGYQLAPVFDRRDNNFLVRCRSTAIAAAPPPAPERPLVDPYPAASPDWPPPAQSWSTPNPWSTTASSAPPAASGLPPTNYLPNGQIDVGY